jgi:hypothetical protein
MTTEIGNSALLRTWANDGTVVVPSNAKIDEGWLRGEQPPHEWMNYIHNVLGQKINHALSRGAADWVNTTEYLAGAVVNHNGSVWRARATNTDSAPADSNSNWVRLVEVGTENVRAAYGGTADAVALTTGGKISGTVPTGLQVRFRASDPNTGATTIALDGGTPIACRTITGVALPSGYIRTDVDTVAIYDGTFWVLDRQIERGSNANGTFTRWADGTMECIFEVAFASINTVIGAGFWSGGQTWTFPAAFIAAPVVGGGSGTSPGEWVGAQSSSATAATVALLRFNSADTARGARVKATGSWY